MKTKTKSHSRLTAAQKRVAIAKDILSQINNGRYDMESGIWLIIDGAGWGKEFGKKQLTSNAKPVECRCCAIGAACVSAIRLFNKDIIMSGEICDYQEAKHIIGRYFTLEQADMIEAAFEGRKDYGELHSDASREDMDTAAAFANQRMTHADLAVAIFKNIIKNKGTFKPEQKPKG